MVPPPGWPWIQANGDIYVGQFSGQISIFEPNGTEVKSFSTIFSDPSGPTSLAVDSTGKIYVVNGGGFANARGTTEIYDSNGNDLGQLTGEPSKGVAVDPSNNHVYVDEGKKVVEFDSAGNQVDTAAGEGLLSGSISLAADSGTLAISNPGKANIATYGPRIVAADPSTDNPVVIDSISSAATRNTGDFEVSPSGKYAVFTSAMPLTGYNNAAHREVFRFDASTGQLACASCNPTGEEAIGEATLASNG